MLLEITFRVNESRSMHTRRDGIGLRMGQLRRSWLYEALKTVVLMEKYGVQKGFDVVYVWTRMLDPHSSQSGVPNDIVFTLRLTRETTARMESKKKAFGLSDEVKQFAARVKEAGVHV